MKPRSVLALLPALLCGACSTTSPELEQAQRAEDAAAEQAIAEEVDATQDAIEAEDRADHARRSGEAGVEVVGEVEAVEEVEEVDIDEGGAGETEAIEEETLESETVEEEAAEEALAGQPAVEMPDLTELLAQVAEIRELAFKSGVPSEIQDEQDFRKLIDESLEDAFPQNERAAKLAGLQRLGLVKRSMDLGEEFANALMTQAAAYYNPDTGTFYYLMTDMPELMLRTTAAHELVHALQDQHFDLSALFAPLEAEVPRNDDRVLAARYLVEGEATYVQTVWQMQEMGVDASSRTSMADQGLVMTANMDIDQLIAMSKMMSGTLPADSSMKRAFDSIETIPRYILVPLMDAYLGGALFTSKVRQARGWEGVSALYADLPESSEQCLHPEKYLGKRDHPTSLALPALPELESANWRLADTAVHGESYLRLLLTEQSVPRGEARLAAAGWDGDIYSAYVDESGGAAIVLMTTWDTEIDAKEFAEAYGKALRTKYPELVLSDTDKTLPGTTVFDCGGGAGHGRTTLRGREFFAVEGVSPQVAIAVTQRLVAAPIEHID